MAEFGTIWRMAVATLAVWRLSRLLFQDAVPEVGSGVDCVSRERLFGGRFLCGRFLGGRFLGGRFMDLLYWLHVWLSAQTAVWVACGFAGVFLSWIVASGASRVFVGVTGARDTAMPNELQEAAQ